MAPVWRRFGMARAIICRSPPPSAARHDQLRQRRPPPLRPGRPGAVPAGRSPGRRGRGQRGSISRRRNTIRGNWRRSATGCASCWRSTTPSSPTSTCASCPSASAPTSPRRPDRLRQPGPLRCGAPRPPRPRPRLSRRQGVGPGGVGRPVRKRARGPALEAGRPSVLTRAELEQFDSDIARLLLAEGVAAHCAAPMVSAAGPWAR